MRKATKLIAPAAIAIAAMFCFAGKSNAQIIWSSGINPYSGQVINYSSGYNPITNQNGSSSVVIDPYSGMATGVGIGQNPYTGTIYRTDVIRYPYVGPTMIYQQRYNPVYNTYRWRTYRGW